MVVIDQWIRKMVGKYDDHTDVPLENEYKEVALQEFHRIFIATGAITLIPTPFGNKQRTYLLDTAKLPSPLPNKRAEMFLSWFQTIPDVREQTTHSKAVDAKREKEAEIAFRADACRMAEEEALYRQQAKERLEKISSALIQIRRKLVVSHKEKNRDRQQIKEREDKICFMLSQIEHGMDVLRTLFIGILLVLLLFMIVQ